MIEVSSSNGSSSEDSSPRTVTRKATKKTTATPTSAPTPSLQMFLDQYPEVQGRSLEEQEHLYMVYKLHLDGATSKDLEKYTTTAFAVWSCCKDNSISTGCQIIDWAFDSYCAAIPNAMPAGINTECFWEGCGTAEFCCQYWPDNPVGSKAWPWTDCG